MDVREKLVELLKTNACPSPFMCDKACKYYGYGDCFPDRFADHINRYGSMMIGVYTELGWMFQCYFEEPTHWMPMPDPPKGE